MHGAADVHISLSVGVVNAFSAKLLAYRLVRHQYQVRAIHALLGIYAYHIVAIAVRLDQFGDVRRSNCTWLSMGVPLSLRISPSGSGD